MERERRISAKTHKAFDTKTSRKVNCGLGIHDSDYAAGTDRCLDSHAYRNFITPFGNSLLVLLTFCWAAFAIYLSLHYSDWLFDQASQRSIRRRDWAITWVLAACAFFAVAIGLWVFGKANTAAFLVADIISVLVVVAVPCTSVCRFKVGGVHQKGLGKVAWHRSGSGMRFCKSAWLCS